MPLAPQDRHMLVSDRDQGDGPPPASRWGAAAAPSLCIFEEAEARILHLAKVRDLSNGPE